jgi:putative SOS response-associated peptidase YedK
MAAIFERDEHLSHELTCALMTTEAQEPVALVHERMPVILAENAFEAWLNPQTPLSEIAQLCERLPFRIEIQEVDRRKPEIDLHGPPAEPSAKPSQPKLF